MTDTFEKACEEADRKKAAAEQAAKKAKANGSAAPEAPPPSIEELQAAAGDLISTPDILARFGADVESAGLVGETSNAKILFLTLISRLFERPVSVAIKGVSAGGKSFTVEQVLKFFPSAAYFVRTGMSEKAIIYSDESYRYRIIVIFEAAGMNSDMMSYLIRTLLSEGRVVYEVVEKTKFGLRPRRIEKEGPTGLITTTTAPKLHPENETRLLSLGVIDTPDQTMAVMQALADDAPADPINYAPWHALQAWLATDQREVTVPFARTLAKLIPPVAVRLRRDFRLLLTLIRAHALLHRKTRARDAQGRIVATVADYAAVRGLVATLFAEGIEATVPPTVRETVTAVGACVGGGVGEISLTALARKLKLDKNSAHHRVRKAIERGYLVNREEKRGMPARIAPADPLPDEIEILPTIEALGELADIFPLVEGAEFDELVADIRQHGLHEPIVVYEDKILDGRNRYRACEAAGIEPTFTVYTGDDPVSYVISLNLRRRHLDESQRAMVAAKLATLQDGQRADLVEGLPIGRASQLLNVGERTVAHAREVQEHGTPELVSAVERGAVSVSAAADVATLSAQEQRKIVARGEREILRAAQDIRARKAEIRRAERIERLAATCNHSTPFPSERRYAVLYADPPWHFEVYNEESGIERAAGNHYPTMSPNEICALPVPSLATPDAVLFMWTTVPHLRESFDVLVAWGFDYKTNIVWVKDKIGLGYFVRNQHELLLVATRGDMPSPSPGNRPPSVITAPRREHSRKPDEAYEMIERMYPELPKIELFARQERPGWRQWGNEVAALA